MWHTILPAVIAALAMGAALPSRIGVAAEEAWVTMVRASPRQMFAGGGTNITCTITPHPDNRTLRMGVSEAWDHEVDLSSSGSRKTFSLQVLQVNCESTVAYCIISRAGGEQQALVPLTVLGCE